MHSKKYITFMLVACGLVTGCVTNTGTLALDGPNSAGTATSGAPAQKIHVLSARVMTERFSRSLSELPAIEVRVTNKGNAPFLFSPANIEAIADSTPVKIYSVEEYMLLVVRGAQAEYGAADARERAANIRRSASLAGPSSIPAITGQIDGAFERTEVKQKQARLLTSTAEMLYPKNVAPGETFGGVIRLRAAPLLSARRLHLRVTIGAEAHEVYFSVNR